jgi:hypothetical protein
MLANSRAASSMRGAGAITLVVGLSFVAASVEALEAFNACVADPACLPDLGALNVGAFFAILAVEFVVALARRRRCPARFESRVAFGGPDEGEDAEEVATPTRQFSLLEITSGLPDDSREADERAEERRLRELRGRVKAARAAIAAIPGAQAILRQDWAKAARFYARFEITEAQFRRGAPPTEDRSLGGMPIDGSIQLENIS